MRTRSSLRFLAVLAATALAFFCAPAGAQLFRAYVAPTGSDANACTLPAPCRLLPAALNAVADGGEIWMLDSANYNTATVNVGKSVTILAVPGALGSVLAIGGPAIAVTTPGVKLALRNLVIVPLPGGAGTAGISMNAGAALTVENCLIAGLPGAGISLGGDIVVRISDTTIRDNGTMGVTLENGPRATLTRSTISGNSQHGVFLYGYLAGTTTSADIAESTVDANGSSGVYAYSIDAAAALKAAVRESRVVRNASGVMGRSDSGGSVMLSASSNLVSNNGTGMGVNFSGTRLWASGNTVSNNTLGLLNNAGLFESAGNNAVRNNGTNKSGTITVISPLE